MLIFFATHMKKISRLIYNSDGNGFEKPKSYFTALCGKTGRGRLYAGDINGDHKDEVICHTKAWRSLFNDIFKTKILTTKVINNFCKKPQVFCCI